jgi:pyridoxal phosphate enzyme (YggS family)
MDTGERLRANFQRVRARMAEAALARGRRADGARLVAVTKTVGIDEVAALAALGQRDFGESRAEQLLPRAEESSRLGLDAAWHMIGHLQRRKVRDLLPRAAMIHSVDSLRLAEEIDRRAAQAGLGPAAVLVEVNVSGEEQKYGARPEELAALVREMARLQRVDVRGLMTMAPLAEDAELARPVFRRLRELRDRLNDEGAYPRPLMELSMGMSQDYWVAVEEGATLVRVGTALFA